MDTKAYIPLRRKTIGVGSWRWLTPPTPHFSLGDTNMLVSEKAKTPDAKPKICVLPNAKPKRKPVEYRLRWVPTQNSGVGHVHFMFFVLISFALGSQHEPSFQWNMGLNLHLYLSCPLIAHYYHCLKIWKIYCCIMMHISNYAL